MSSDDEQRIDAELRDRARQASELHSESVSHDDINQAWQSASSDVRRESRRQSFGAQQSRWLLASAAAVLALLVAGIAWWPSGEPGDRVASVSEPGADINSPVETVGAESSRPRPTTAPAGAPAGPPPTAAVERPSIILDTGGNEIATFGLVNDRIEIEPRSTAFADSLLDYLLHRSTILGGTLAERQAAIVSDGLRIRTTLDPEVQDAADKARDELPDNDVGIDAAIVAIETSTGAVRAIVSGNESARGDSSINTALEPRPTGSAVDPFILAAALQAGAQPDDLIDGRRGCVLPGPWSESETGADDEPYFEIRGGVAGDIGPLRDMVERSIACASARLSHIVGLERVVDAMYRLANSPYLFRDQSPNVRMPIEPMVDLASGVNPMSPLDMASGMQSIANGGVHEQPYFVEYVEDADGAQLYRHRPTPTTVLDRDVALRAVDVLRGTITRGTGRRHPLADDRPAIGKTGTNQDNTDAWFIGATPQLTTAVWVGDPDALTPMVSIPEFDVPRVQGGNLPARIWKAFSDDALADAPIETWAAAPAPKRPAARLVLPDFECVALDRGELVGPETAGLGTIVPPGVTDPNVPIPSVEVSVLSEACY